MKNASQLLVGFALETNDEEVNALSKMQRKNLDMIVLNSLNDKGCLLYTSGQSEFIYALKNRVLVMDNKGKLLFEKHWEGSELDFPYVYRFSTRDSRIGMMDGKGGRLFLLDMKDVSKGFPIRGNSPFSIAFGGKGSAGFRCV